MFNDDVTVAQGAAINVDQAMSLAEDKTFSTGETLSVQAHSLQMNARSSLHVGKDAVLSTVGDQSLATLDVKGSLLDIDSATGSVHFTEQVSVQGQADIQAKEAVALGEGQALQATSDVAIQADRIHFEQGSLLSSLGHLTINTNNDTTLFNTEVGAQAIINTGSDLTTNGQMRVGNSLTLDQGGNIHLKGVTIVGQNLLVNTDGHFTSDALVQVGQNLTLTTAGSPRFGGMNIVGINVQADVGGELITDNLLQVGQNLNLSVVDNIGLSGNVLVGQNAAIDTKGHLTAEEQVQVGQSAALT